MSSEYQEWYDSINRNDPELKVDSSVCNCIWEPPMTSAERKEHFKLPHPYRVSCTICGKTWRYTYENILAWEAKFEYEQMRGHSPAFGIDGDDNPLNQSRPHMQES